MEMPKCIPKGDSTNITLFPRRERACGTAQQPHIQSSADGVMQLRSASRKRHKDHRQKTIYEIIFPSSKYDCHKETQHSLCLLILMACRVTEGVGGAHGVKDATFTPLPNKSSI